ncbi:hypothetical protein [uncultured Aquimarina sp.]|uniref:Cap15 family cyclic dinucleotide receptor domain-containing protein n=1 Tax=uncultured Aquimarina sp. TaxID=575652 RepID=UPI0026119843|nr:hypothetical protein [uncultured Aquimarina sp.]
MKPDFNFKYYDESKLILLVILLYVGSEALINLLINLLKAYNIEYHRFYPATILLGIIFWLINKNLHKIPFLWKLLIKVPLIRGTYQGNVKYNYQGVEGDKHCKLIIYQTTSDIKVDCYFWDEDKNGKKISSTQTKSESIVEDLIRKDNGLYQLLFYYQQKGSNDSSIPIRDGFNTLTLKEDGKLKRLEGGYFSKNSLSKGNGGTISVDFQTKELKHI